MSTRTVSVVLQAEIGQYVAGMTKAAAATKGVGETAETSTARAAKGFDVAGKAGLLMGGLVAGALVGVISKSMDFEKSMSAVQAATQASVGVMGDLRDAAIKAGADTQYSATEAADAITEMAKAGVSAKDIMGGGLTGALSLAAAGQLDVADAAGIASTAMTQFSLSGKDLPHVADLLAAGAGKAMGSVDDLGQALNQAGLLASSTGISIEETTGTLAAFASAGLIGSDAGTSFKTMLQQLQAPSKQAQGLLDDLGISAYNTQGQFVGIGNFAQQLKDKLGGLTQAQRDNALATIFGTDASRAATVLYREGAAGIADWTSKVNDAGYAQKQAAQLTDNLAGDLERLGGSVDTLLISIGQGLQGPLRGLTQMLGGLADGAGAAVNAFNDLSGPMQLAIGAAGLWAIAGGKITDVLSKMSAASGLTGTWRAFGEAMDYARANGDGLGTVLKSVGEYAGGQALTGIKAFARAIGPELGIGLAVAAIPTLIDGFKRIAGITDVATGAQERFKAALEQTGGVINANVRKTAQGLISDTDNMVTVFRKAGISAADAVDGLMGNAAAQDRVSSALQNYITTSIATEGRNNKNATSAADVRDAYNDLIPTLGAAKDNQDYFADSSGKAGEAAQGAANATSDAATKTQAASEAAQKAYQDWINSVMQVETAFVDPLSTYKQMVQDAATATANATKDSKDSWQDYADSAKVSLDQFAQHLQDQITAQENWHANLVKVAQRAGYDVAAQLQQMGVEGAGLVAQMANSSDAEMQRMAELLRKDAANGGAGAAAALDQQMKIMAEIGKEGGAATANNVAAALGIGLADVAATAAKYGVTLAEGINPVLASLGKTRIVPGKNIVAGYGHFAAGGYTGDGPKFTPAGIVHRGEFVFPQEAVNRIGVSTLGAMAGLPGYASGGFVTAADVPKPYSTAPYGPPISTAGDGTMQAGYDATTSWLNANMGAAFSGVAGAGVQRWLPLVIAALNMLGQPTSLAQTVLRRMQQESGGNPMAINNWDINAKRGTPSKGLMQVIDPTFRAYAMPGHNSNIYDPLSNLLASARYAIARYGSLAAAYNKAGGYANGGTTPAGDPFWVGENGPELMWSSQSKYVSSAAKSREFSGGAAGGSTTVQAGDTVVKVYIDGQEFKGIARVEAQQVTAATLGVRSNRSRYNG